MNKKLLIVLFIFSFGCTHEINIHAPDVSDNENIISSKSDVRTYEIVHLIIKGEFTSKYIATFGTEQVELLKTSDSHE